ncbi:hypothetical protein DFH09DRAFT_1085925 [Mycena vulgaris]|nr:hypothetical protein DFH09DRAFT_1085925 [Mycena vulgaris]
MAAMPSVTAKFAPNIQSLATPLTPPQAWVLNPTQVRGVILRVSFISLRPPLFHFRFNFPEGLAPLLASKFPRPVKESVQDPQNSMGGSTAVGVVLDAVDNSQEDPGLCAHPSNSEYLAAHGCYGETFEDIAAVGSRPDFSKETATARFRLASVKKHREHTNHVVVKSQS